MWTGYSPGCIVFFYFFWLHSELNGNTKNHLIWHHHQLNNTFYGKRNACIFSWVLITKPHYNIYKMHRNHFSPFTLQTLLVVWGLKGQCLGCLRGEAFYPSCIRNNREENFLLRSAPHDQYPSCHLQGRDTNALITVSWCRVGWSKPSYLQLL